MICSNVKIIVVNLFKNLKISYFLKNDATAITIFFRRQAGKNQEFLRIKLQKLNFCSNALRNELKVKINQKNLYE
jgi:hypothetical protein